MHDNLNIYNAEIDMEKCVDCGACLKVCQVNQLVVEPQKPILWYQGWHNNQEIRKKASSGGIATALAAGFIEGGGLVCSCVYRRGEFGFEFAEKVNEVEKFTGSKYVKSNPKGIYYLLKKYLQEGRKVLFIGLPCQVAAVKNFVGLHLSERLYTADLICHGTPSPKVLNLFLSQYNKILENQTTFKFRDKDMFQIAASGEYLVQKGAADCYSIAFLNALTYTENCYSCKYACLERVSDVTLGDSWGSELPVSEQKKGVSLLLVQTQKGKELIRLSDIHLQMVNLDKAIGANHQLEYPSKKCKGSEKFWKDVKAGKNFNCLIIRKFIKQWGRQAIKRILLKLKIIQR